MAYYSVIVAKTFLLFFLWGQMVSLVSPFKVTTPILRRQLYPEPHEKPRKADIMNIPRIRGLFIQVITSREQAYGEDRERKKQPATWSTFDVFPFARFSLYLTILPLY